MTREYADRLVLERIGVLILVHHEVLEAVMEVFANFCDIENLAETEEEIIEIESIFFSHLSCIGLIDFEDDRTEVGVHRRRVFCQRESRALRTRYSREDSSGVEFLIIDILGFHDFFHSPETVI